MFKALIDGLMTLIQGIISILMAPIDTILGTLFPSVEDYVNIYNNVINSYVSPTVGYLYNFLPPNARNLVGLYCTFMITLGTATIAYHTFTYIYRLIKNIKFW